MTRIIAGSAGGRRIAVPPRGTRPTADRVREALFSRLDHEDRLRGARVLDAFAGSGALGLEAISRGAVHATFVESDARAAATIRANCAELGFDDRCVIVRERVLTYLSGGADDASVGVAFVDPPYDLAPSELARTLAALAPRVSPAGILVVEWSARADAPEWPAGFGLTAAKAYGDTALYFAAPVPGGTVEP